MTYRKPQTSIASDSDSTSALSAKLLLWTVLAYPVLWVVGLAGIFWIALALISLQHFLSAKLIAHGRLLIALTAVLAASAIIGTTYFGFSPNRLLGLVANMSVWFSVGVAACFQVNRLELRKLSYAIVLLSLIQGVLTTLAMVIYPQRIPLPLLSSYAGALPSGMAAFAEDRLAVESWLGGVAMRSAGVNGNPTWSGAFACIAIVIAISMIKDTDAKYRNLALLSLPFSLVSVYFSLSRSAWVLLALVLVYLGIILLRRRSVLLANSVALMAVVSCLAALLAFSSAIFNWIANLEDQRQGSSVSRGGIYEQTWSYITELPLAILGYGIKPQTDDLVASVASHSTYLGMLFRGGLFGLLLLVAFFVILGFICWRLRQYHAVAIVLFVAAWCVLEDLDTGHLLPLGLIWAGWSCQVARSGGASSNESTLSVETGSKLGFNSVS